VKPTVAVLAVAVAVLVITRPEGADVAQARKDVLAAVAHAKIVESDNRILKARADSALIAASKAERVAVAAKADLRESKQALFKAALAAPDTCGPIVLAAQQALNDADSVIAAREHELAASLAADSADRKRADDAEAALSELRKPAMALVTATKPSFWRKLRPELHAGVTGGIDAHGKPNVVVGIGAGWRF